MVKQDQIDNVPAEPLQCQQTTPGWGNALALVLLSMLVYIGVCHQEWSWEMVLLLVPILLLHECGRYLALRLFHYRNARMFFLPFFGAAATGRHYQVPGWQKAIVALMGPLPGIGLGIILGLVGLALRQAPLVEVAFLALIVNGLSLLPVLPSGAGWILHDVLFARHYLLDMAFRVIAIGVFILLGMSTGEPILMCLGLPLVLTSPTAYRLARLAGKLRPRGLAAGAPDEPIIPTETAQAILAEVKHCFTKTRTDKTLARHTVRVYESLNARPPGWLASLALLGLQGGAVMVMLFFAVVFVFVQRAGMGQGRDTAAKDPTYPLACGSQVAWQGAGAARTSGRHTILATCPTRTAAEQLFHSATNRLPPQAKAKLFGNTLLLSLPAEARAARKTWAAKLQRQDQEVLVDNPTYRTTLALRCAAPSEALARTLREEVQEYLYALDRDEFQRLIPPWLPGDTRTPEQRQAHRRARQTFRQLEAAGAEFPKSQEASEWRRQIEQAERRGEAAEAQAITARYERALQERKQQAIENLRRGGEAQADLQLLELYVKHLLKSETDTPAPASPALREIAQRMGLMPAGAQAANPGTDCCLATEGTVSQQGTILSFQGMAWAQISEGAPALADWLCARGCTDFKYKFSGYPSLEGLEEN